MNTEKEEKTKKKDQTVKINENEEVVLDRKELVKTQEKVMKLVKE